MPVLVFAVVAFIIFNVLMAMMISAVVLEKRQQRHDEQQGAASATHGPDPSHFIKA